MIAKVSVVIPCYKQAQFPPQALQSILHQTTQPHEIVVVEDGSADGVERVVQRFPDVRYVQQRHRGVSAARNTGLRSTSGKYVVFLDADDRLLPHHVQSSLQAFERNPAAALVIGDYRYFGEGDLWHVHDCHRGGDLYCRLLLGGFPGVPATVMVRR